MSLRHVFGIATAAMFLVAVPAQAAALPGSYDDTTYPDVETTFATDVDERPIVTGDVTYAGPHEVLVKELPAAGAAGALGLHDDTAYATAEPARPEQAAATQVAVDGEPRDGARPCRCS